jgi:hypothetical protein
VKKKLRSTLEVGVERGSRKLYPDRPQRSPAEPSMRDAAVSIGATHKWRQQTAFQAAGVGTTAFAQLGTSPATFLDSSHRCCQPNNSNRETKVRGTIIATACIICSNIGTMADKCLRSRSIAGVGDGQGNPVVKNVDENVVTDCCSDHRSVCR